MIVSAVKRVAHLKRIVGSCAAVVLAWASCGTQSSRADTVASLLGNFTINQFCGLELEADALAVRYAVVFGQLPALRELHLADADGNGVTTQAERDAYVGTLAPGLAEGLDVRVDGVRVPLHAAAWSSSLPTEQGGFSLRIDVTFSAALPATAAGHARQLEFSNHNYAGRLGWHEIAVVPTANLPVYDTNAYATSLTGGLKDALRTLPATGPLDERSVHLVFGGAVPAPARLLGARPGSAAGARASATAGNPSNAATIASTTGGLSLSESAWIGRRTRQLVDAISGPRIDSGLGLLALLGALMLGGVHALSPGHGKTIVGAYLIGSRGTPRHAAFLGLTVTVTHTVGVFALGFAMLYASRFVYPERLFPILSTSSALLVLGMGIVLLVQRGRAALVAQRGAEGLRTNGFEVVPPRFELVPPRTARGGSRGLMIAPAHAWADPTLHSHGGGPLHSHLPPGAAGEKITWRSLLTLGVSGGLVPCPSAMVLLLAAVALNKTAYGMLLVLAFSLGLAITLTLIGLLFLHARNRFQGRLQSSRWTYLLPVLSAGTISVIGVVLLCGALLSF